MANRQYIGARYVPKFYQGSNGNEWDSNVPYEALTMVTYLSNTYCSKKPVPPSTITPNEDTEHWVLTAAYSSQTAELREIVNDIIEEIGDENSGIIKDINDVENNVTELYEKVNNDMLSGTIVIIGDSYLEGYTPSGTVDNWGELLASKLKKTDKVHLFAKGRTGFAATYDNTNFSTQVDAAYSDITIDNDDVTLVLFGGGFNDHTFSYSNINLGITAAVTKVHQYFPNAKCCIAYMAWDEHSAYDYSVDTKLKMPYYYGLACDGLDVIYLNDIYKALQLKNYLADSFHPNANGQKALANALFAALTGTFVSYGVIKQSLGNNVNIAADENNVILTFYNSVVFSISPAISSYTCNGLGVIKSIDLNTNDFKIKPGQYYSNFQLNGYIHSTEGFFDVTFIGRITDDGVLNIAASAINNTNNNFLILSNISEISIYPGQVIIPRIVC